MARNWPEIAWRMGRMGNPVGPSGVICHAGHGVFVAMGVALMDEGKREQLALARWETKEEMR
jgi:hypothetical protein